MTVCRNRRSLLLLLLVGAAALETALAINCFQCSGTDPTNPFVCNEFLENEDDLELKTCESVYGAKFCIKHTGRFEVSCIECYQCDSTETLDCSDVLINDEVSLLKPEECNSVFEARYCIKSTGLRGGIGTRRFCSSLDLGNYCNYVQNKGDQLEYRSCIFTCDTDGCNSSSSVMPLRMMTGLSLLVACGLLKRLMLS